MFNRMRGRLAVLGVAACSALAVVACGSDDEPSGSASQRHRHGRRRPRRPVG